MTSRMFATILRPTLRACSRLVVVAVVCGVAACQQAGAPAEGESQVATGGRRSGTGGGAAAAVPGSGGGEGPGQDASGAGGSGGGAGLDGGLGDTPPGDGSGTDAGSETGAAVGLIADPLAMIPADLKDVGLFPAFPDMTRAHPRALAFRPRHELWSNGLGKARFAVLPPGQTIDATDREAWRFPVGSLFFKTFFQDSGGGVKGSPVETRLIRRIATSGEPHEQWEFVVWQWSADGKRATRAEIRDRIRVKVVIDGRSVEHDIPKRADCWNCHIANKSPIIGFDELRLNVAVEGQTGQARTQLEDVIARGWVTPPPRAPFAEITDPDPLQRQVKEWIHGNCAHCHNKEPPLEPGARYPELDLRWDRFMEDAIGKRTMTVGTAVGTRIVPGRPLESVLFLAVEGPMNSAGNASVKIMPPVGVNATDAEAINRLRTWITRLPPR